MIHPYSAFAAWLGFTAMLFLILRPRRAVLVSFLVGWLFLPFASFRIEGLPIFTKVSITSLGVLGIAVLMDAGSFLKFRFCWLDLPIVVWCIVPFISSVLNGLGAYDGVLEVFNQTVAWGLPYFVGRVYFHDAEGMRDLALGVFIGGLFYIPFCVWELRMSPHLHKYVYGFGTGRSAGAPRFGGYRPRVFMHSGLALGLWMTAASLTGVWLWTTGARTRLWAIPMTVLVPVLLITTVMCKSLGALLLLIGGLGALLSAQKWRLSWPVIALLLVPVTYIPLRTLGLWSGEPVITIVSKYIDADRARSFAFRLEQEDILVEHALARPTFGWGGWGRHQVKSERGRTISVTDGLWVIALGRNGYVGLAACMGSFVIPAAALFWRIPRARWSDATMAAPIALATVLALFSIDNLLNAKLNSIFMVVAGGIAGFSTRSDYRRGNPLASLLLLLTSDTRRRRHPMRTDTDQPRGGNFAPGSSTSR